MSQKVWIVQYMDIILIKHEPIHVQPTQKQKFERTRTADTPGITLGFQNGFK